MIIRAVDGTDITLLSRGSEKRVLLSCDQCGKETKITYSNYCRSQTKHPGKTFCRPCSNKESAPRRSGRPAWNKGRAMPERRGSRHPQWKGGTYVASDGYRVKMHEGKYEREHRIVASKMLGRKLKRSEIVHHKDGDRLNSKSRNLHICTQSDHQRAHHSLDKIGYELFKRGLIVFKNGEYAMTKTLGEM